MKKGTVKLVPWLEGITNIDFQVRIGHQNGKLQVEYQLRGPSLQEILIPERLPEARREDGLWEYTCFESFLTWGKQSRYWELNFSPSGAWNCYRFEDYRSGQTRETQVSLIQTSLRKFRDEESGSDQILFTAEVDLSEILPSPLENDLQIGVTSVIKTRDEKKSYWAIIHSGLKPDFHLRESFTLNLE